MCIFAVPHSFANIMDSEYGAGAMECQLPISMLKTANENMTCSNFNRKNVLLRR